VADDRRGDQLLEGQKKESANAWSIIHPAGGWDLARIAEVPWVQRRPVISLELLIAWHSWTRQTLRNRNVGIWEGRNKD
jgi:hypothetical protein